MADLQQAFLQMAEIQRRLTELVLSRIEAEIAQASVTLQTLIDELQRTNVKADTTMIEHQSSSKQATSVIAVQGKKSSSQQKPEVFTVNHTAHQASKRKFVPTIINGMVIPLQLDAASDITVISTNTWKQLGKPALIEPTIQAINASGKLLDLVGEFAYDVSINGRTERGRCFISTSPELNLLGIEWIEAFKLWSVPIESICNQVEVKSTEKQIQELCNQHAAVFNESLGRCTKTKVKLYLKPNTKPVFCPKRPVPFNTIPLVDAEPSRSHSLGILTPMDFSEWAAYRIFIDDITVFGPNKQSHLASLNKLLDCLKQYELYIKAEKCNIFQPSIRYLGHIMDGQGICPDPEKLKPTSIPAPSNVAELRAYVYDPGGETLEDALTADLSGKFRTVATLRLPNKNTPIPTGSTFEKQNVIFNKNHGAIKKDFNHGPSRKFMARNELRSRLPAQDQRGSPSSTVLDYRFQRLLFLSCSTRYPPMMPAEPEAPIQPDEPAPERPRHLIQLSSRFKPYCRHINTHQNYLSAPFAHSQRCNEYSGMMSYSGCSRE